MSDASFTERVCAISDSSACAGVGGKRSFAASSKILLNAPVDVGDGHGLCVYRFAVRQAGQQGKGPSRKRDYFCITFVAANFLKAGSLVTVRDCPRCFKKNPCKAAPAAEDQPRAKQERHAPKQFNPMPDYEPDHRTWTRDEGPMHTVHTMLNFALIDWGGARGHETNHAACRRSRFSNKCRPFIRSFVRPTFIIPSAHPISVVQRAATLRVEANSLMLHGGFIHPHTKRGGCGGQDPKEQNALCGNT